MGCTRTTAAEYSRMCRRQCAEIEAVWEKHADKLPRDEMIGLSWAAVERHQAEKRRVLN